MRIHVVWIGSMFQQQLNNLVVTARGEDSGPQGLISMRIFCVNVGAFFQQDAGTLHLPVDSTVVQGRRAAVIARVGAFAHLDR